MSERKDTHHLTADRVYLRTQGMTATEIAERWNVDLLDCWLETVCVASVNLLHDANVEAVISEGRRSGVPGMGYDRKLGRLVGIVNHAQRMQRLARVISAATTIARAA